VTLFKPSMLPVLIGSLPVADHDEALRMVFEYTPEIPLWAQLLVYPEEGMMVQFLPGMPGVTQEDGRVFIDTSGVTFEDELLNLPSPLRARLPDL